MEERASSLSTDAKRGNTEGEEEEERQDLNLIFGRVSEEGEKVTFLPLCMKRRGSAERERGVKSSSSPLAASAASLSRCRAEKEKPFVMLKGSEGGGAFCQNKGGNLAERLRACMVASFLDPSFFLSESSFL